MRLFIQLRGALSGLLVVLLVAALASAECVACGVWGRLFAPIQRMLQSGWKL